MELPAEDEHGQSVILEEEIDENYEPTEEEILEYAGWLGMNLEKEKDLLWIASEGLKAPLPEDWKPCRSPEGDIYYFNFSTGESVWDHPCDEYYRKLYQDEKKKKEAAGGREPIAQSSSAVKPTAASTKVYQAPQKLSSLDSISGLKRKDDPFKRGSKLLGQSPTKDERPALLKSIPNLGTERKAELAQEEKIEKYIENLKEIYSKEENVLRKLQQQKLSNQRVKRPNSWIEKEAQLMDRISALKEEHEEKVSEVLDADKSYKKKWSPLSAHINKSVGAIDKNLSANDTVSTMHSNARSVWDSDGLGMDIIPPLFVCPITQELMREPVIAEDGYTYERKAIAQWTSRSSRSPMTNQEMKSLNFISNYALRSAIKEWQQRHGGNH